MENQPGPSDPGEVLDMAGAGDASLTLMDTARLNENEGHPFLRALTFDLVVEKLLSYLTFEDMKALSAVSIGCLAAVRKTNVFSERAKLIISKEVVMSGVLKECDYQWKHLSLDLTIPVDVVGLVYDILESAASLSLRLPDPTQATDKDVVHYLSEIFKHTKNLQTLRFDASLMSKILHDVFSDVNVQTLLTKLQCLDIQSCANKPSSVYYIDGSENEEDIPFQRNFLQLSMVPLKLKRFVFGKIVPISGSESAHVKFIPKIVEATKDTLEELELHLNVWKYDEMEVIRCPKLKSLRLSANGQEKDAKIIKTFLKNQPPLEELVIEMKEEFPISILLVLQGMLVKMKKLHLKAKEFSETSQPVDWRFLETMNELRDFRIRKPSSWNNSGVDVYGHGEDILAALPVGCEKITLQGFDPFWKDCQFPQTGNIGALLERFENLKELNLLRSGGAVTDDGLQSIIANCSKLVSLTFSHCSEVTDFGISGIRSEESEDLSPGLSLKNLKGLTHLKIRSCPNITAEHLLKVTEFPFLRFFDYYRNVVLPKSFLLEIAKQNPSLEAVALHITSYEHDTEYEKQLIKEAKEINPRLHQIEMLEGTDWQDEDSDSDASSMKEDGDSDFSGGGFYAAGHDCDFDDFDDDYDASPDFDEPDEYDDEDGFF